MILYLMVFAYHLCIAACVAVSATSTLTAAFMTSNPRDERQHDATIAVLFAATALLLWATRGSVTDALL